MNAFLFPLSVSLSVSSFHNLSVKEVHASTRRWHEVRRHLSPGNPVAECHIIRVVNSHAIDIYTRNINISRQRKSMMEGNLQGKSDIRYS